MCVKGKVIESSSGFSRKNEELCENAEMRVAIIPGGQIIAVDSIGYQLMIRCEKALEIFQGGEADYILTTGGLTNSKEVQTLSEAEIVRNWLTTNGVPKELVISENQSLDSFGNIQFGFEALSEKEIQIKELIIVSQWQHTLRYWITLRLGYHVTSKIRLIKLYPKMGLKASLIEWIFILYHLLDPKGSGWMVKKYRQAIRNKRV